MQSAAAQRTLFIGDDIFLAPDACEKHFETHKKQAEEGGPLSIAVLGHTAWDPDIEITKVMKWLEKTGWQFGYSKILRHAGDYVPESKQHRFSYSSHISILTDVAKIHPFREDVSDYGWEDIEWGERLKKPPVKLFYEPQAKAYHYHAIDLEKSLARMEQLGRSIKQFKDSERHPGKLKLLYYQLSAFLPTLGGKHRKAFLKGIRER